MKQAKELFLTFTGILVTLLHVALFVGIVTCAVGVRIYVLGDDPAQAVKQVTTRR